MLLFFSFSFFFLHAVIFSPSALAAEIIYGISRQEVKSEMQLLKLQADTF